MSVSEQEIHAAAEATLREMQWTNVEAHPETAQAVVRAVLPILRPDDMTLVGRCRDCRWVTQGLKAGVAPFCHNADSPLVGHPTSPDFGCVHFSPVTPRNR